ncbi:MAG: hypothetical protein K2X03_15265 [Bryobacteraceae bacterium]|nr:hypothetical protein [Bryobacteraceae bacterium]
MPRPISEAQRAACQSNAQKSTGPRTEAGKSRARLNAVKHGLTAKLPVLPFENEADFIELRDGFLADFAPRNTYEKFLVTQLATQAWRVFRYQNEVNRSFERARKAVESSTRRSVPSTPPEAVPATKPLAFHPPETPVGQTSGLSTVPMPPQFQPNLSPKPPA